MKNYRKKRKTGVKTSENYKKMKNDWKKKEKTNEKKEERKQWWKNKKLLEKKPISEN